MLSDSSPLTYISFSQDVCSFQSELDPTVDVYLMGIMGLEKVQRCEKCVRSWQKSGIGSEVKGGVRG